MSRLLRWGLLLAVAGLAHPQQRRPAPPPEPDEAEDSAEPEYTFNPIQAKKELEIGDYYFKRGSYRAAAGRYERSAKWQPDLADAYYKLAQTRARLDEAAAAAAAYEKYLGLSPPARKAAEVRKKLAQLRGKGPPPK